MVLLGLIKNKNLLPKDLILRIFKEPAMEEPITEYQKKFQRLRQTGKRLLVLHDVLENNGMLDSINEFLALGCNMGDLRFLLANADGDVAVKRLEDKYKDEKLSECQIDADCDLGRRILTFVPRKLIFKTTEWNRTEWIRNTQRTYWSRCYANKFANQREKLVRRFNIRGVITRILIKTRSWQNTTIVQGIRVCLDDGKTNDIGILPQITNHRKPNWGTSYAGVLGDYSVSGDRAVPKEDESGPDFQAFKVPRGQWLHNVKIESSDMHVNKLEFFTNAQDLDYDQCENLVADKDIFHSAGKSWFLSGMRGGLCITDGVPSVCDIQFEFHHCTPDISYYEKFLELN